MLTLYVINFNAIVCIGILHIHFIVSILMMTRILNDVNVIRNACHRVRMFYRGSLGRVILKCWTHPYPWWWAPISYDMLEKEIQEGRDRGRNGEIQERNERGRQQRCTAWSEEYREGFLFFAVKQLEAWIDRMRTRFAKLTEPKSRRGAEQYHLSDRDQWIS